MASIRTALFLTCTLFCFAVSAEDDPLNDWIKVSSPHLILYTDHKSNTAKQVVNKLLTFREVIMQFMKGTENEHIAPLSLVLFRDKSMWSRLREGQNFAGYFSFPIYGPSAVVGPGNGKPDVEVLYHEYVHYLVHSYIPHRLPHWYEEGMAEFFSTVAIEPEYIYIGAIAKKQVNSIEHLGLMSSEGLFTQRDLYSQTPRHVAKFYSSAWLLSHYFTLGARNGFPSHYASNIAYMAKQRAGLAPEQAFAESFDITMKELDREVQRYARSTKKDGFAIDPLELSIPTRLEKLSSAQAKAHLATVYGWSEKDSVGYEYLLSAAEQNEPFALSIRAMHHSFDRDTEKALAKLEELDKLEQIEGTKSHDTRVLYNQFRTYEALAALSLQENNAELASTYTQLANTALDKSLSARPYMPSMLAQVQRLLESKTEKEDSKDLVYGVEQLLTYFGNHHVARRVAASAYLQLGDTQKAQSNIQSAIELLPHGRSTTEAIQAIVDKLALLQTGGQAM